MAFSEIELNDLKYMVENGFKLKEICEVLGKSMDTIRTEIKLMKLKSPRKFREKNGKIFCLNCREYKDKKLNEMIEEGIKYVLEKYKGGN